MSPIENDLSLKRKYYMISHAHLPTHICAVAEAGCPCGKLSRWLPRPAVTAATIASHTTTPPLKPPRNRAGTPQAPGRLVHSFSMCTLRHARFTRSAPSAARPYPATGNATGTTAPALGISAIPPRGMTHRLAMTNPSGRRVPSGLPTCDPEPCSRRAAQCRYQPPQPFQSVRPAEVSTRSPKYAFRFAVDGAQVASSANPRSATELATLTQPSIPQHHKADGTYDYADTFPRRVRPPIDESSGNHPTE